MMQCFKFAICGMGLALALAAKAPVMAEPTEAPTTQRAPHGAENEGRERKTRLEGRGPRGGEGKFEGGFNPKTMTSEQIDEVLGILREVRPDRAQQFEALRKENPEAMAEMIRDHLPRLMELGYLKRNDPEMFKLRIDDIKLNRATEDLAMQYRQAKEAGDEKKLTSLKTQILAKLAEHYNIRQKIRERDLAKLEKQIAELKTKIEAGKKSRDEMIQQRMEELTGKTNRPEW
jgi:hypothetical protein